MPYRIDIIAQPAATSPRSGIIESPRVDLALSASKYTDREAKNFLYDTLLFDPSQELQGAVEPHKVTKHSLLDKRRLGEYLKNV